MKVRVEAGAPLQVNAGESLRPSGVCCRGTGSPGLMVGLLTVSVARASCAIDGALKQMLDQITR